MKLPNGHYCTDAGSTVHIYGKHSGCFDVVFDWFEEENACIECSVNPQPEDSYITWTCDECGGGAALLKPCQPDED